jgi:hypothetical protein
MMGSPFIFNTRRANVVGFDHEAAPIVSAITSVNLPDGTSVLLVVNEAIYNITANHSLLSEFQLIDFGVKLTQSVTNMKGHRKW